MTAALMVACGVPLLVGLPACAEPSAVGPPAARPEQSPAISSQQRDAMADGVIDKAEYEAGYRAFIQCLKAKGVGVAEGAVVNGVRMYSYAAGSAEGDRCYEEHFGTIDGRWQIQQSGSQDETEALRDCLRARGVAPRVDRAGLTEQLAKHGIDQAACVAEWMGPPP